jgi:hypothetical protein
LHPPTRPAAPWGPGGGGWGGGHRHACKTPSPPPPPPPPLHSLEARGCRPACSARPCEIIPTSACMVAAGDVSGRAPSAAVQRSHVRAMCMLVPKIARALSGGGVPHYQCTDRVHAAVGSLQPRTSPHAAGARLKARGHCLQPRAACTTQWDAMMQSGRDDPWF